MITYDEHGGFFDHVQPPAAADDRPAMRRYGPRVPALVVSPYLAAGSVSKTVFDHTSIIKTILTRFAAKPNGKIPNMGKRVAAANHLGELLTRSSPRRIKRSALFVLVVPGEPGPTGGYMTRAFRRPRPSSCARLISRSL